MFSVKFKTSMIKFVYNNDIIHVNESLLCLVRYNYRHVNVAIYGLNANNFRKSLG